MVRAKEVQFKCSSAFQPSVVIVKKVWVKDAEGAGDVWFHLLDGLVVVLFPLGDGTMISIELGT